jgi:hypothetical protein
MAFHDINKVFYNGEKKIIYLDKPHMYFVQDRINWDLPVDDAKAWGKKTRPKGTTTLLDDTLEKKGLMTWPLGLALGELFGFYNFKNNEGEKMIGFSKGDQPNGLKGTIWGMHPGDGDYQEQLLPLIKSASEAWQRKKQKGADIGSVVHSAIEHFITGKPFNVLNEYTSSVMAAEYETPAEKDTAVANIPEDVEQAEKALKQFKKWWSDKKPTLLGTEDLVYSKRWNVAGTYDGRLMMDGKMIIADWKTSNASTSREACAPQGVYYTYFIQSAIYAMIWEEMTGELADDLLIVSCRKDGEFDTKLASEVGLSVEDCILWAKSVISCYRFREIVRKNLWEQGKTAGRV